MLKFIDLNNGKIYDGSKPYIHWFGDGCSTNLIYNIPLCFISDKKDINININSDIFFLIDVSDVKPNEFINGFEYRNIQNMKSKSISSTGIQYNNYYIHYIYVGASSNVEAEYIDDINIDGVLYNLGFSAYSNNEILNINLSNKGISIPNQIQKAIYEYNVHEDKDDNILLNRKWKELLSNYWDVVACRGSYKSAINSIKWFEWGELIRIREMWKYNEFTNINKTILEDRELKSILLDKYKNTICRFAKSTYLALYVSMQQLTGEYDAEKNPILKEITTKWSKVDLMLKLSLLGSFYESYFLPIHVDLIHCTIEDIVFTDVFKIVNSVINNREDYIYDYMDIKSNINNDIFTLSNAQIQVSQDTNFGTQYERGNNYDDIILLGVQDEVTNVDNIKTFWTQNYNGIGVIVPVKLEIDINNDFIKYELLSTNINGYNWPVKVMNKLFHSNNGKINIDFNLLCNKIGSYEIRIQLITGSSRIYTTIIKFSVIDISNIYIKLCKIKHLQNIAVSDWFDKWANDYNINRFRGGDGVHYIPTYINKNGAGIALNNILIFKYTSNYESDLINFGEELTWVKDNYFITTKLMESDGKYALYTICVSKKFWYDPAEFLNDQINKYIYRNDYGFFPEFHALEEVKGKDISDIYIYDDDAMCLVPVFKGINDEILFEYGKNINTEWEFINASTGEIFKPNSSIKDPFISTYQKDKLLPAGFYNVLFKYKIGNEEKKLYLNSIFIKKDGLRTE